MRSSMYMQYLEQKPDGTICEAEGVGSTYKIDGRLRGQKLVGVCRIRLLKAVKTNPVYMGFILMSGNSKVLKATLIKGVFKVFL